MRQSLTLRHLSPACRPRQGAAVLLAALQLASCDSLMTSTPRAGDILDAPLDDLSYDLNAFFAQGDANFDHAFTPAEGLGPIFNNLSCAGCHPGDGRGTPELGFVRFSRGPDLAFGEGGPQHQDKSLPGVPVEDVPAGVDRSFRLPPPVFGVGLVESIPVDTILAYEDPGDADGDGISGRAHWVVPPPWVPEDYVGGGPGVQLGRFSRKAQVTSLLQQVAEAYHGDIGITSDFLPVENPHPQAGAVATGDLAPDPEIPAATVLQTVVYVRLLQPPARGRVTEEVRRGQALFASAGCAACHVPLMHTGPNRVPALDRKPVAAYSDLLLHDMGPGLADGRPDRDATGSEWRTAPLWGTRLVGEFLGGQEHYLHDGRATTLDAAVDAHGGEAQAARDAYTAMSQADRQALIAFLESL